MSAPSERQAQKSTTDRSESTRMRVTRRYFATLAAISPALAEWHAMRVFSTPGPRRLHDPRTIAGVQGVPFRVRSGRRELRCWSYGEGPTLVCVHGWGGCAGDWSPVAEALVSAGFRIVLFDFPGHGASPNGRSTLVSVTRDLHAVAGDVIGARGGSGGPLHAVLAHSFGGAAATLALTEGLPARSLVLVAPVAHPLAYVDATARALGLSSARRDGMVERLRRIAGGDLSRIDVLTAASRIGVPGLVIHDRSDTVVPWSNGREIAYAWGGAHFVSTDGLGHRKVLRSPEVMARIAGFLGAAGATSPSPARF